MTSNASSAQQLASVDPVMPSAPKTALPTNACDAHAHVFGPYDEFPLTEVASYPPPLAPAALYAEMLSTLGATRGVLVQPAPYGTDARPMLDALRRNDGRVRGIAVATADTSEAALQHLFDEGIRGLRFVEMRDPQGNPYKGSVGVEQLKLLAPVMKKIGLHAQLWASCDDYARILPELVPLGLTLVLDHMACVKVERGIDDPSFKSLLVWLEKGAIWIKLSVCRVSRAAPTYADLRPFHDALVATNSSRLLWGSDWPFVRMGEQSPDVGDLLDLFYAWVPDPARRQQILVDNPALLYGFSDAGKDDSSPDSAGA
ncbi:amidohydrolase [Glaciimonas sp. PCH181]|uniref:amidohydrolase family protein n=1 Tax=Glaciimonas sp. PCH181 TaxID=2133943 RepID=UPI000D3428FF|nr:amidohydrolase family protein [Glaciimonas sp. PCH181]PUA16333.1 2-pyrone-4,6-dicarboxylate hydrolase [Glaciimonas sp. PCH181]